MTQSKYAETRPGTPLQRTNRLHKFWTVIANNYQLYIMLIIPVTLLIIFCYVPMYGAQIAFKNYSLAKGIWNSPWAGFKWFEKFVNSAMFIQVLGNTLLLNVYSLAMGFPFCILLALSLNYVQNTVFKKTIQMISYAPNFISTVVMTGIMFQLFSPIYGVFGQGLSALAGKSVDIFLMPGSFRHIMVWSGVWQGVGFGSIIYISALSAVSPELHEAAIIDGANILQRVRHVDFPVVLPVIIVQLILSMGGLLSTGYEKVLLLQNTLNLSTSEVVDTYAYKMGLKSAIPNHSYGAAIGLFKSVICFILLAAVNRLSNRFSETSLW